VLGLRKPAVGEVLGERAYRCIALGAWMRPPRRGWRYDAWQDSYRATPWNGNASQSRNTGSDWRNQRPGSGDKSAR